MLPQHVLQDQHSPSPLAEDDPITHHVSAETLDELTGHQEGTIAGGQLGEHQQWIIASLVVHVKGGCWTRQGYVSNPAQDSCRIAVGPPRRPQVNVQALVPEESLR